MWKKPDRGAVKINVDASFCAENLSGATGAVARDDKGDFIASANWFIPHVSNVDAAEIIAVRNGMILSERIGCNSLIIESDSTVAVEAFNQQETYFGPEAAIIRECKQMELEFAKTFFVHCFRKANEVADSLARNSLTSRFFGILG